MIEHHRISFVRCVFMISALSPFLWICIKIFVYMIDNYGQITRQLWAFVAFACVLVIVFPIIFNFFWLIEIYMLVKTWTLKLPFFFYHIYVCSHWDRFQLCFRKYWMTFCFHIHYSFFFERTTTLINKKN